LCLPHPKTLTKLILPMTKSVDSDISQYLKLKSSQLSPAEQIVAIQMDEIYVTAALNYAGGKLIVTVSNGL
jgi:hypothetical protein